MCNLHLSSRFSSPFSHPYLLKQDDITNSNGKGKAKALTFLVSFHQQFLNAYYRSLEGKSYKCGRAEFTFRRLSIMPIKDKKQKNSEVVETHFTTKLSRRTSYRSPWDQKHHTLLSGKQNSQEKKVILVGSMRSRGTDYLFIFFSNPKQKNCQLYL